MTYPSDPEYSAPIPPYEDKRASDGPRYLPTEPMPGSATGSRQGSPFGSAFPGMSFPGMQTGNPGVRPGARLGAQPGMPVVLPRKSPLLAAALAALLGPMGMIYATFLGAFVMMGVWFWTLLLFSDAFPFVWAWGVGWALLAAHRKNQQRARMETYLQHL